MRIKFDLVMHWLYAIVWALLAISGFAMTGANYGWLLNFNIASADYVHRVSAAIFVILTLISVIYEVIRGIKNDEKKSAWLIIGKNGYQLFIFITSLIFIITGALIWFCMEFRMSFTSFPLLVHEYLSYVVLASVIWHIYKKCHILLWPKKARDMKVGR
ncbi:cytochrome b/b6 domain-containing protein [Neobacillus sp. LXY-4]|uniref:cytochrome b/b6 domain-containing protein n=1 Tax=Neobacillus sp. LXY-4 TaxID=3379826 RepID=UPI003EE14CDD